MKNFELAAVLQYNAATILLPVHRINQALMSVPNPTTLVQRIQHIDDAAAGEVLPLVYDKLRQLAAMFLQKAPGRHCVDPTDLVHQAYAQLIDRTVAKSKDRARFLAVAARAMRTILVDHARYNMAQKRGGGRQRITFSESITTKDKSDVDLLSLNDAIKRLSASDERAGLVVELRYFGGLTIKETSEALNVSRGTVWDDWRFAKAWLGRELGDSGSNHDR